MPVTVDEVNGLDAVEAAFERQGLTPDWWAKELKAKTKAKTTKFFAHEGKVISKRTLNDNAIQLKALIEIGKARGWFQPTKLEHGLAGVKMMELVSEVFNRKGGA